MEKYNQIFNSIFKQSLFEESNKALVEKATYEYPYFSPANLFLLHFSDKNSIAYAEQAKKTSLLFNNNYWLNFQLLELSSLPKYITSNEIQPKQFTELPKEDISLLASEINEPTIAANALSNDTGNEESIIFTSIFEANAIEEQINVTEIATLEDITTVEDAGRNISEFTEATPEATTEATPEALTEALIETLTDYTNNEAKSNIHQIEAITPIELNKPTNNTIEIQTNIQQQQVEIKNDDTELTVAEEELPIIEDKLLVKEEELPVDEDKLPVNEDELPVDKDDLPVEEDKLPINEDELPVAEEELPVDEDKLAVNEDELPVDEDDLSVDEDKLPVSEEELAVDEDKLIVNEDKLPVNEDELPVAEEELAVDDDKLLVNEDKLAVNEDKLAVNEDELPVAEEELPVDEDKLIVNEDELPVAEEELAVAEEVLPVDEVKLIVNEDKLPVNEDKLPINEDDLPVDEDDLPVDEEDFPNNNYEKPVDDEMKLVSLKIAETLSAITTESIGNKDTIPFEPLHTSDYFASVGIKLSEDVKPSDKLGLQLKSFTQWLKTMKKIHENQLRDTAFTDSKLNIQNEKTIQQLAEESNKENQVVTEAMAEVLVQQGKIMKAVELYEKLSLLDPSKKVYFAAKLKQLKG